MAERKRSAASSAAIWVIVGLLMFAMVGFGASGLSGTARSLGSVGEKSVGVQQYYIALTNETRAAQQQFGRALTQPEIQALGIDQRALAGLIAQRALDQAATDMGLSVGDEEVRKQITAIPAFTGLTGSFDRQAYKEILQDNGLSEAEFETSLREAAARDILAQAVAGGISAPASYANAMLSYIGETRDIEWVRVGADDFTTGLRPPSEEELKAYYDANSTLFIAPAMKTLKYIWVTPDMILDQFDVAPEAIQAAYDERAEEFNVPETRIVDRLIFPNQADADAAKAAIDAGDLTFEQAVQNRGLTLEDVELGDIIKETLDAGEADAVFAAPNPGVVGPVQTNLGPALFRISAILDAQVVPLADVEADLRDEIARLDAERAIAAEAEAIADLLAGGATLEEVADESLMVLETADWHLAKDLPINAYSEFQERAGTLTADDFPELQELSDGGVFAVEFVQDIPETVKPYAEVADDVAAAWEFDAVGRKSKAFAQAAVDGLAEGAALSDLGMTVMVENGLERTSFVDGVSPAFVAGVFNMTVGQTLVVEDAQSALIVRLKAVHPVDATTPESQNIITLLTNRFSNDLSNSIFDSFARAAQSEMDVKINEAAVASVVSQVGGL
ncbi:MAG: peptidylprolyl isomerase [Planktomarina sp.]